MTEMRRMITESKEESDEVKRLLKDLRTITNNIELGQKFSRGGRKKMAAQLRQIHRKLEQLIFPQTQVKSK